MPGILGKPVAGYFECPFSLSIPKETIFEERADVTLTIIPRKSVSPEAEVFDYCKILSRNKMEFIESPEDMFFPATGKNAAIKLSINAPRKQIVYSGATILLGFLTHSQRYSCGPKKQRMDIISV